MAKTSYFYGLGRRKSSTARARLFPNGKGDVTINGQPSAQYLADSESLAHRLVKPLNLLEKQTDFDISLLVSGGGTTGQVDACALAISNALAGMNDDNRSTLKKAGMLKRDSREKERKKYGLKRARKAEQYTKR
jgi:small subunit ribosomal protein S9